jgi:hypothetical protein
MNVKRIFLISFFSMLCVSSIAHAGSHQLSTRQLPNDEYEAVITFSSLDYCLVGVNPPSAIQIIAYDVLITSPAPDVMTCIGKAPPEVIYEYAANIGKLTEGEYTITWVQEGTFNLSTLLKIKGYSPIPSTSIWALFLLALVILVAARPFVRPR